MVITLTLIYMSINYVRTIFARISGQTLFLICSTDRPKSVSVSSFLSEILAKCPRNALSTSLSHRNVEMGLQCYVVTIVVC